MDKQKLFAAIEKNAAIFTGLSDRIWEYAELSMEEYKSTADYVQLMKQLGFQVEENLVGIPTAFSGKFGSGRPVIGILGEFDALSGLSQVADETQRCWKDPGGCGHGCGHNLLGAAALAAAYAIKEAIEKGELTGTVVFYGCPGEEGCAGKTFMARDGMFRDLDAAITWHPGSVNEVTVGSNMACLQLEYTFTGLAAHAAGNPEMGRSALDAAELMHVGVQFLREHMPKTASVHYSYLDAGGVSPNVVQPTAKVMYMVRDKNVAQAKKLLARVHKIAQGAAMMTETEVTWRQIDGTASTLSNTVLEKLIYENFAAIPLPVYTDEEVAYAQALKDTYPSGDVVDSENMEVCRFAQVHSQGGKLPINNFLLPHYSSAVVSPGSTDVGDVSWLTPTAQFSAVTWPSCAPGHSWQIVSAGKSALAHKGMILAAKVLAGVTADLMTKPQILTDARAEFEISAADGYDCPIGPEVTIPQA